MKRVAKSAFGLVVAAALLVAPTVLTSASAQTAANTGKLRAADIVEVTPTNMKDVVAPATSATTFVLVCDATAKDCVDRQLAFSLNAAKAQGGWLGPHLTQSRFYFMDANAANWQELGNLCSAANIGSGWSMCLANFDHNVEFIMYEPDSKTSKALPGPIDNLLFPQLMTDFQNTVDKAAKP